MSDDSGPDDQSITDPCSSIETLTSELADESSAEEYFDCSEDFASSSICLQNLDLKDIKGSDFEAGICDQSLASSTGVNVKLDKCYDALSYFAGEGYSSFEDTKIDSTETSIDPSCVIELRADDTGNIDYVDVDFIVSVEDKDIKELMQNMAVNHYSAESSQKEDFIHAKCKALFEREYICEAVDNFGGCLSVHYPERLIIPVAKKTSSGSKGLNAVEFNKELYKTQVEKSSSSRLRTRFVAPVILLENKFICRSGTLTVRKTAVFETVRKSPSPKSKSTEEGSLQRTARNIADTVRDVSTRGCKAATQLLAPSSIRKLRDVDAHILKNLSIQYICDLMIEDRKKFKQIRLSSSEKINTDIYRNCNIEQMPYPGCQFFKTYHEANHVPEGLIFDWNRPDVDAEMKFTEDPYLTFPDIDWEKYKEWDVVDLTKNYMKILLSYLAKDKGGLLVHCVSGWDRTPLFISILRLSLWADGVIHESLNFQEMAYLTLAYDWYLFGHDLPTRIQKKEEIMHFCFKFLQYISTDEFSITRIVKELPLDERKQRIYPAFKPDCRDVLNTFSAYVLKIYDEIVTPKL